MEANKKWMAIPKEMRSKLIANVFCTNCLDAVTITDFIIFDDQAGVRLEGRCKNCRKEVTRVVEMED